MTKTLRQIGNSKGIILDRTMLEHIGSADAASVELTMEAGKIVISAARPGNEQRKRRTIEEAAEYTVQRYDEALRRLADAG